MQKVLIDCDPGNDDATAILYAAAHLDLVRITTVYGNQTVDKTTANALALLTLLERDVPVARGCSGPLNGVIDLSGPDGRAEQWRTPAGDARPVPRSRDG